MIGKTLATAVLASTLYLVPTPQETPTDLSATYSSVADAIIALHKTESNLVRSILDHHYRAAQTHMAQGEYKEAAAQIALFGSEGDNAVGGVRKRLVEGGHHHHAAAEEKGIYDPGFVVVTRKAKQECLQISQTMRRTTAQDARDEAWGRFEALANRLKKTN